MSHSYVSNLMHCTFSTKERYPWIDGDLESRLWPYIGGIAREHRMKALTIGGVFDHVHALLSLPSTMSFAKAVQLIKGGSSKWIHDEFRHLKKIRMAGRIWSFQCKRVTSSTIAYIERQKEHHRKRTFKEEFITLLDKHHVVYDPRYVFR